MLMYSTLCSIGRSLPRHTRLAVALPLVALAIAVTPAFAAFPGSNNAIVFQTNRDGPNHIYRMGSDGFGPVKLSDTPGQNFDPAVSADGTKIAFTNVVDGTGNHEIVLMNADGTAEINLTKHPARDEEPAWFPGDARKLALQSDRTGNGDLYALVIDATGTVVSTTRLTTSAAHDARPAVSPDGTKIAFASDRDGDFEIYVMNAAPEGPTNVPKQLTQNTAFDFAPDWSPNGAKLAFNSDRTGNSEVFVMRADGTGQTNLTKSAANDGGPAFSPDGTKIAFVRSPTNQFADNDLWRMRADGANPVQLTSDTVGAADINPTWQPLP
jgi:Tol biopolymer transport system component